MLFTLLDHGWKKFWRSASLSRDLATTIFLVFMAFMISSYLIAFSFFIHNLITAKLGQPDSLVVIHKLLLYYFFFEFMMRYILQNVPVLGIQPYLHLPIKRHTIIHFLLGKSIFHFMNLITILLFAPYTFTVVAVQHTATLAWIWLGSLWFISLALHYIVILYKVKLDDSGWGIFILIMIMAMVGASDYFGWFNLSAISLLIFNNAITGALLLFAAVALVLILYGINYKVFNKAIYSEGFLTINNSTFKTLDEVGFLKQFGAIGDWINLEIKLILRHKRTRTLLFLSTFFLLYGLIFYDNERYTEGSPGFLLFVGILVTGIFLMNYGQYLYSWQAIHFDFTLTKPVALRQFVEAKYWLLVSVTFLCFLLSIPYVYFGWNILLINGMMALFNIGVNSFIIMNLGLWSPKKIDLQKGGAFNIQGAGAAQWVMGFPLFLAPYIFYLPLSLLGYPTIGLLVVGFTGLVGFLFRSHLLSFTAARLQAKKHRIAAGFRKE